MEEALSTGRICGCELWVGESLSMLGVGTVDGYNEVVFSDCEVGVGREVGLLVVGDMELDWVCLSLSGVKRVDVGIVGRWDDASA